MALKSQGTILKRAGTAVAQVTGITGPDGESSEIDITNLSSVQKEYLIGLADAGNLAFTGFWDPSDPAQIAMRTDRLNQTSAEYTVTLTDGSILTITAYVKQFGMAIAPDGAVALNGSLRITGAEVWT